MPAKLSLCSVVQWLRCSPDAQVFQQPQARTDVVGTASQMGADL